MDRQDYKPNSHKYQEEKRQAEERKKVAKVVSGSAKVKTNNARKLADTFIADDAKNIKSRLLYDTIIPALKNTIEDVVVGGIRMALRGDTRSRSGNRLPTDYVSYGRGANIRPSQENTNRASGGFNYREAFVESRGDAENVLLALNDQLAEYGQVSMADLYDALGLSHDYTICKYGWTDLRSAEVVPVRGGFVIKLPKAVVLK